MNSTESTTSTNVRDFFDTEVAPRSAAAALFPTAADPAATTYYVRRRHTTMTPASFEILSGANQQAIEDGLKAMWAEQRPDWVPLAPRVAALAGELHHVQEQEEELSPFIYVMF